MSSAHRYASALQPDIHPVSSSINSYCKFYHFMMNFSTLFIYSFSTDCVQFIFNSPRNLHRNSVCFQYSTGYSFLCSAQKKCRDSKETYSTALYGAGFLTLYRHLCAEIAVMFSCWKIIYISRLSFQIF